jgi:CheY-like chemotaxis protein
MTILVVDDQPANRALMEYLLQRLGHQARTVEDAQSAMAAIAQEKPYLILMDVQLPGIDGLELTRRIKGNAATEDIIIVAVTSYAMSGDRETALAAGCDGYLAKPIDMASFSSTVTEFYAQRQCTDTMRRECP